uniref:hypothetical chloroplast RF1 n=1 Tax=Chlorococcum tatrense TaxID=915274 RepID=UPI0010C5AA9E|nr:hypothetical chloroplast RF1 [Chlorococcum tatrense]AYQ94336.1 hypothetical chloroplast RF1 [Chlorococcum tatrense]
MISILSLITSIKDYLEVVHKFIEYDSVNINYTELGSILTFFLISIKNCMFDFFSFSWLPFLKENFWSLPIIIPEISSAMISEISVLDGYFHNAFNFLDTPVSYGMPIQNGFISCLEKLTIGLINSFFLFLPTSTAHIITLRRFVMQGLDAGYISGLGTIAGNIFWLGSVILGCRFFVIPWLSLDIFRYVLGFILLVKYMWDTYNERKTVPTLAVSGKAEAEDASQGFPATKRKIFLLNFLLALTEQTSIYPFISNISINPEISILETFPGTDSAALLGSSNGVLFISIHLAYLLGIGLGSLSLLHLSCWFWENPAFKLYMWVISSFKISTSFYYKLLNFSFLYLTMLSAICSIPYYGLDYTITNPLGYVNDDRIIQDKVVLETSFLGTKASDRNTRRNRGRHGRRERWKRRIRKYRTFDASLYDQGIYDLFTIEDLNYGFDRFWLRRKLRNHRVRFRFFPGPWMRSFKKQLAKPRLESYTGPRVEFFRILFEQVYHPSFHSYNNNSGAKLSLQAKNEAPQDLRSSNKTFDSLSNSSGVSISNPEEKNPKKSAYNSSHSLSNSLYSNNEPFFKKGFIVNEQRVYSSQSMADGTGNEVTYPNIKPLFSSLLEEKESDRTKKSTLRKFIRKFDNRVKTLKTSLSNPESSLAFASDFASVIDKDESSRWLLRSGLANDVQLKGKTQLIVDNKKPIYSKQWKNFAQRVGFLKKRSAFLNRDNQSQKNNNLLGINQSMMPTAYLLRLPEGKQQPKLNNFYLTALTSKKEKKTISILDYLDEQETKSFKNTDAQGVNRENKQDNANLNLLEEQTLKKQRKILSKKDLQILHYRSLLTKSSNFPFTFDSNLSTKSAGLLPFREAEQPFRETEQSFSSTGFFKGREGSKTKINLNKNQQNKIGESLMLLHPLKFYLQKEAGFKRKLRYYTPSIYRKFSVENNAPYFRVMMKRYFYNYKPSLRWERTMKTASLRKARRKTTRIPRKLQNTNLTGGVTVGSATSSLPYEQGRREGRIAPLAGKPNQNQQISNQLKELNQYLPIQLEKDSLQKSTYNYSVVSKRANRYRYQIYKDVLQHWYYSPFNRILLKLDVDSFIRRQPNAHFLTSKEENLLHLRRFLLSEHYNTLRWYTNMEHYRSMKTQLNGGTKSFASRSYNQQFSGTFKKIRHLFAITPSITNVSALQSSLTNSSLSPVGPAGKSFSFPFPVGEKQPGGEKQSGGEQLFQPNVLKFDQPLYNEYANNSSNPLLNPLIIHEELLPDLEIPRKNEGLGRASDWLASQEQTGEKTFINEGISGKLVAESFGNQQKSSNDLVSQSQNIIREYLTQTRSVREDYIKKLLSENNYAELTKFIYKGQKIRGEEPATNQKLLNNQEKNYLLTLKENNEIVGSLFAQQKNPFGENQDQNQKRPANPFNSTNSSSSLKENFYLTYLKKWKRHVNDQESLKNYLTRRLDKREKRKQKKEKQLLTKLQRLENWFALNNISGSLTASTFVSESEEKLLKSQQGKKSIQLLSAGTESSKEKENLGNTKITKENERNCPADFNSSSFNSSNDLLTSGLQKSILEGMFTLKNNEKNGVSTAINNKDCSLSSNKASVNEKNLWKFLLLSKIKAKETISNPVNNILSKNNYSFVSLQDLTLRFNDIKYAQNLKLSNNLKTSIQATRKFIHSKLSSSKQEKNTQIRNKKIQLYNSFKNKVLTFSNICLRSAKTAQNTYLKIQNKVNPLSLVKVIKPIQRKSLKDWRKKERVLGKQKRSRKEFKLLNKKTESISTYLDRNELQLALQIPDRKKRDLLVFPINSDEQPQGLLRLPEEENRQKKEQINLAVTFKRKRSPQRRSRVRRNRGVFKKRSLSDSLRKDFVLFYNEKNPILKSQYYEKFNENLYGKSNLNLNSDFKMSGFLKKPGISGIFPSLEGKTEEQSRGQLGETETSLKQRKSKQRKERYWKQKRSKYAQKRRKYRKRRRYTIVKIRTLNKQFKRIKNQIEIQNWWWKQFTPSIQASNEALWQIEKDKLIQQKLSQLSTSEILERDSLNSFNFNILQIGNKDFKPLALPYAIRLNKEMTSSLLPGEERSNPFGGETSIQSKDNFGTKFKESNNTLLFSPSNVSSNEVTSQSTGQQNSSTIPTENVEIYKKERINQNFQVVNKLYESLFINNTNSDSTQKENLSFTEFLVPNTNLPFYAGWDESLRKLIVTNRMLSRKEAGFSLPPSTIASLSSPSSGKKEAREEFTLAPLQGMNAATTLYWQIPFTTYDPDQFFALGMDGFSPIGWRKFLFRHSILKTWLVNKELMNFNNSKYSLTSPTLTLPKGSSLPIEATAQGTDQEGKREENLLNGKTPTLIVKTRSNILKDFSSLALKRGIFSYPEGRNSNAFLKKSLFERGEATAIQERGSGLVANEYEQKKSSFAVSRRLKKRYRRVKKHPRTPVWFPSGPLLNQVLPVHYIYVFYKRARLPRDRYLKRRLINVKDSNLRFATEGSASRNQTQSLEKDGQSEKQQVVSNLLNYDFTLRKRLKPKRKYHLKRDYYASNVVIPRRFKFMSIYSSVPGYPNEKGEYTTNIKKWRPLSSLKIHKPISEVVKEQQLLRRSAQQKQRQSKQQQPSMRVKQLRRRVQRQILRSVWRYRPRAGGFVWPGDYLKLELVKAPKLQSSSLQASSIATSKSSKQSASAEGLLSSQRVATQDPSQNSTIKKQKRKKKRTLVEWQIQPKKYLYEKHNIKVLKKKLLQSQRSFGSNTTTLNVLRNSIT